MANIVKQSGQADDLFIAFMVCRVPRILVIEYRARVRHDGLVQFCGYMHDAQGMFKPSVHCSRVHVIGPSQLADSTQALEWCLVYDISLPGTELDEAVYGTAELESAIERHLRRIYSVIIKQGEEKEKIQSMFIRFIPLAVFSVPADVEKNLLSDSRVRS